MERDKSHRGNASQFFVAGELLAVTAPPGFGLTCRASGGKKGACLNGVTLAAVEARFDGRAALQNRDSLRESANERKWTNAPEMTEKQS
jgi:hypothetical protein